MKVKEVAPSVFHVEFPKAYDLAMTFVRYQEFYESPKFRGEYFKIMDYIEWYSKNVGNGSFTYPNDYDGFNIPSVVIDKVLFKLHSFEYDIRTNHDEMMMDIRKNLAEHSPYYLIGTSKEKESKSTINHEIAHGLFYTNSSYQEESLKLTNNLPDLVKTSLYKCMRALEYHPSVWDDEINSYMATGLRENMKLSKFKGFTKPYVQLFNKFYKGSKNG